MRLDVSEQVTSELREEERGREASAGCLCKGPVAHSGNSEAEKKLYGKKKAGECPGGKQGLRQSEIGPEMEPGDDVARVDGIFCDFKTNK